MDVKFGSFPDNYRIPSKEELDGILKDYNWDISKHLIEEMQKEVKKLEERMVIDDMMAISSGKYKTYDDYLKSKMQIIADAVEMNRNNTIVNSSCLKFTYYVQPSILSKDVFDYIVEKYEDYYLKHKGKEDTSDEEVTLFFVRLNTGEIYAFEIGYNFEKYCIANGKLYDSAGCYLGIIEKIIFRGNKQ